MSAMLPAMREHYAHCEAEVRAGDKDRFLAALFAPAVARPHLFALYAFDLEIGRIRARISEPLAGEIRLQWWRDALDGGGEAKGQPVAAALLDTIERRSLARRMFLGILDARAFDLYDQPMPTLAALQTYADATAGALLRLAARVLSGDDAPVAGAVAPAGRAFAYTGFLRALALHASRRQVFVPVEVLERHGAARADVVAGRTTPALLAALNEMREQASAEHERARGLLRSAPAMAIPAFLPLALVPLYLARMARPGYDPFRTAIEVPQWRRQWALWRAAQRRL